MVRWLKPMKVLFVAALVVLLSGCTGSTPDASLTLQDTDDGAPVSGATTSNSGSPTAAPGHPSNTSTPTAAPKPDDNQTVSDNKTTPEPQSWKLDRDGWASLESATLRPGSRVGNTDSPSCTANFLFTNPQGTKAYIGTAAHCTDTPDDDPSCDDQFPVLTKDSVAFAPLYQPTGAQPVPAPPASTEIGRFVYSSFVAMMDAGEDDGFWCAFNDFALIELNDNATRAANPAMWHYGGPTALATAEASVGDLVHTFGGTALRNHPADATRPRDGVVVPSERTLTGGGWGLTFHVAMPGACIGGDSGSPLTTEDGLALGVVTRSAAGASPSCVNAYLAPMLDYMATHGGPEVVLATA